MGTQRDKQQDWANAVLRISLIGLAAFLVPLFLLYVVAQPAGTTMVLAFGVDLSGWIVLGVVGALAWSISGDRRIALCSGCGKLNMVSRDGDVACRKCKTPL